MISNCIKIFQIFEMSNLVNNSWLVYTNFLVEGVLLLTVAIVGLVGNILSFIVLNTKGLQKTFHKLLLLLNIFDMVSTRLGKVQKQAQEILTQLVAGLKYNQVDLLLCHNQLTEAFQKKWEIHSLFNFPFFLANYCIALK